LHLQYVVADELPLISGKREEPLPNWLVARVSPKEDGIQPSFNAAHNVPKIVRSVK
jgi:hypothetical protein